MRRSPNDQWVGVIALTLTVGLPVVALAIFVAKANWTAILTSAY